MSTTVARRTNVPDYTTAYYFCLLYTSDAADE